jgi:hypothetical protein
MWERSENALPLITKHAPETVISVDSSATGVLYVVVCCHRVQYRTVTTQGLQVTVSRENLNGGNFMPAKKKAAKKKKH